MTSDIDPDIFIGIGGLTAHGKDTVGALLVREYGFRSVAYADGIRAVARRLFDFSDAQLHGDAAAKKAPDGRAASPEYWERVRHRLEGWAVREQLEELFGAAPAASVGDAVRALRRLVAGLDTVATGVPLTPRRAMQRIGTEWGQALWKDVWVEAARRRMRAEGLRHPWCATDLRHPHEAVAALAHPRRGEVWWIDAARRVPPDPAIAHDSESYGPATLGVPVERVLVLDNNGAPADLAAQVAVHARARGWERRGG